MSPPPGPHTALLLALRYESSLFGHLAGEESLPMGIWFLQDSNHALATAGWLEGGAFQDVQLHCSEESPSPVP